MPKGNQHQQRDILVASASHKLQVSLLLDKNEISPEVNYLNGIIKHQVPSRAAAVGRIKGSANQIKEEAIQRSAFLLAKRWELLVR